jgi:diguanylate cyclase
MPAVAAEPHREESERLRLLRSLEVLDTAPEAAYDDLVNLAAQICGTPIGLVSLVDVDRQWFKARQGIDVCETSRELAFCAHAVVAAEPLFSVPDATLDARFADNPLVTGAPYVRFYAGARIEVDGLPLGTICVIDTVPRCLDAAQRAALEALARQAGALFELRQRTIAAEAQSLAFAHQADAAATERQSSAELLELVLQGGNLGLWDMHPQSGRFTVNARELAMLGYTADSVYAETFNWRTLVHPDDWGHMNGAIARHLADGSASYECEHRMYHAEGRWIWVHARAVVVERDPDGRPVRVVGTHLDITERLADRREIERVTALLQRTGAMARVGGWELEPATGRITWTDEVYRIHEVEPGTSMTLVSNVAFYPGAAAATLAAAVDAAIRDGTPYDLELPFVTATGRTLIVRTQGQALREGGVTVRLSGTFQDVTELKRVQRDLQRSEERLALALSSARFALFDWDVVAGVCHRGANLPLMRGAPAAEILCSIADVRALIHQDDRAAVAAALAPVMGGLRDDYEFEHRIQRVDGSWLWLRAVGRVTERGADGAVARLSGVDEDISARKSVEHALASSERRLRTIADNLPALVAYVGRDERYQFLNAQIRRIFGVDTVTAIGKTMRELRGDEIYASIAPHVAKALRGEATTLTYTDSNGGRSFDLRSTYIPDIDETGQVLGFYAMTFDITELLDTQRKLEALARQDTLTGLANRRRFDECIEEAMCRSRRSKLPLAVLCLDIDHFKAINDTLGHAGGDAVLQEFGRRLAAGVRTTDTVARLGGDEFVVLLENVEASADVGSLAAKLIASTRLPFLIGDTVLHVTTSVGAAMQGGESEVAAVISRADTALYRAKQQGRDRYAMA